MSAGPHRSRAASPEGTGGNFYRTAAGAEINLLLTLPGDALWAIEIKRGTALKLSKGFHQACADLNPVRRFAVYGGAERFPLGAGTDAIGALELAAILNAMT